MRVEIDLHPSQAQILRDLVLKPSARFGELNSDKLPTDHFSFHLKRLQEIGWIRKKEDGAYELTDDGKHIGGRLDTETAKIERQAKVGVSLVAVRQVGGVWQYLAQERLKQPYYGYHGFVTGKIRWGMSVLETAARELQEETGLVAGKMTMMGVMHKTDLGKDGEVLDDKFFFRVRCENLSGELKENDPHSGRNFWCTREELLALPNQFPDLDKVLEAIHGDSPVFIEKTYSAEGF
ncbi:MAG: NUDIX hydrolase [Candidatus Liptonbacteria bacterium]|nr:NUDIX hydrolase [Candidatus Liptonbacteria bacterium]